MDSGKNLIHINEVWSFSPKWFAKCTLRMHCAASAQVEKHFLLFVLSCSELAMTKILWNTLGCTLHLELPQNLASHVDLHSQDQGFSWVEDPATDLSHIAIFRASNHLAIAQSWGGVCLKEGQLQRKNVVTKTETS